MKETKQMKAQAEAVQDELSQIMQQMPAIAAVTRRRGRHMLKPTSMQAGSPTPSWAYTSIRVKPHPKLDKDYWQLAPFLNANFVDLADVPLHLYNSNTGRWKTKNGKAPEVRSLLQKVEDGDAPAFLYDKDLYLRIQARMMGELDDFRRPDGEECAVPLLEDQLNKNYPRFSTGTSIRPKANEALRERAIFVDFWATLFGNGSALLYWYNRYSEGDSTVVPTSQELFTQDPEEQARLVEAARAKWRPRNCWNHDAPHIIEFEDASEMRAKLEKHCSMIPGFKVTMLRKRRLAYFSDGQMKLTPDAINHPDFGYGVSFKNREHVVHKGQGTCHEPCIYLGDAWACRFEINGVDYLGGNVVYFATPEQFEAAFRGVRDDLVPEGWTPYSDLIFISSDWCERNGQTNYDKGFDLSTPNNRRLAVWQWILGPLNSRTLQYTGKPISGFQVSNGYDRRAKIDALYKRQAGVRAKAAA